MSAVKHVNIISGNHWTSVGHSIQVKTQLPENIYDLTAGSTWVPGMTGIPLSLQTRLPRPSRRGPSVRGWATASPRPWACSCRARRRGGRGSVASPARTASGVRAETIDIYIIVWKQGILKGEYHCTVDLLFDWFGISCRTTDIFCFYFQNRLIQTSQTGGQWYSDPSPFRIPWWKHREVKKTEQGE